VTKETYIERALLTKETNMKRALLKKETYTLDVCAYPCRSLCQKSLYI